MGKIIKHRKRKFGLPRFEVETMDVKSLSQTYGWGQNLLNLKQFHQLGLTGKGVKVAVLDTAIDDNHPDLFGRVVHLEDFTGEGFPSNRNNWNGHGTGVAGTIAAKNNDIGVIGWAYDCDIYGLKCLQESGAGRLDWIVNAVRRAIDFDVDIINLSLGASQTIPELTKAFGDFLASGDNKYIIAATGNGGSRDPVNYPAAEDIVWGVGSMNDRLSISSFSSTRTEGTDVLMPGENILTTWSGNGYASLRGTSFSAPAFAGIVACFLEGKYRMTRRDVHDTGLKASGRGGYKYPQLQPLFDRLNSLDGKTDFCEAVESFIEIVKTHRDLELQHREKEIEQLNALKERFNT